MTTPVSPSTPNRGRDILQGEIYWVAPEEDRGSIPPIAHPYVVVQDDLFNASRIHTVIVCGISSNLRRVMEPGTVLLDQGEGGLHRPSVVLASQVSCIDRTQLGARIGRLDPGRVGQVLAALRVINRMHQAGR